MSIEQRKVVAYLSTCDLTRVTLRRMCSATGLGYWRVSYVLKRDGTGFKQLQAEEFERRINLLSQDQLQRMVIGMYSGERDSSRWDFFKALREVQV